MKALTVFARGAGALVLLLAASGGAMAQAPVADPIVRARELYNAGRFDEAVSAAREAGARPGPQHEANLLLGRALLERHRSTRVAEDLDAGRQALRSVDATALPDRGRLDLVVGLGEALYLDGQYRSAAAVLEPALEQVGALPAPAREQVVDWWATAMDRHAQTRPPDERARFYDDVEARMRQHLGRHPDSSAASYWLPAVALAQGQLDLAWDLALAGWVRAQLAADRGEALRGDLDRLVTQAIIPERVKRLVDEPDTAAAAARFAAEWDEMKARWSPR